MYHALLRLLITNTANTRFPTTTIDGAYVHSVLKKKTPIIPTLPANLRKQQYKQEEKPIQHTNVRVSVKKLAVHSPFIGPRTFHLFDPTKSQKNSHRFPKQFANVSLFYGKE
jgi:hypothetical protein